MWKFFFGKKQHLNLNMALYSLDAMSARLEFIEFGICNLIETKRYSCSYKFVEFVIYGFQRKVYDVLFSYSHFDATKFRR